MKNSFWGALTALILVTALSACQSEPNPKKPAAGYLPDTPATEPPAMGQAQADPNANPGSVVATGDGVQQVGANETFEQRNTRLVQTIFAGYKQVEMDPMDAFPNFKTAQKSEFKRLRKLKPTNSKMGERMYPRLLMKSYRFASWEAQKQAVEEWLNEMEHSGGDIELGAGVKAVKSPPIIGMLTERDFFMVQWSCVYQNAEWDSTLTRFFEVAETEKAKYGFDLGCHAGELKYRWKAE